MSTDGKGEINHDIYQGKVFHTHTFRYLAEHNTGAYIPIKDVAARQDISLKYIERIMPPLKAAGFIESSHGIGGGYRLVRDPDRYTLWDILRVAEGDLAPVACLQEGAAPCKMAAECKTLPVWQGYYDMTKDYFSNIHSGGPHEGANGRQLCDISLKKSAAG